MVSIIKLKRGEGKRIPFLIKSAGVAVDLTSYADRTYSFMVKNKKGDATTLISKSNSDFIMTNESTGYIYIDITHHVYI